MSLAVSLAGSCQVCEEPLIMTGGVFVTGPDSCVARLHPKVEFRSRPREASWIPCRLQHLDATVELRAAYRPYEYYSLRCGSIRSFTS